MAHTCWERLTARFNGSPPANAANVVSLKTFNGRILTRNGLPSCTCCDADVDFDIVFGPQGDCDCGTVQCFNAATNPSPSTVTVGGTIYTNTSAGTDLLELGSNAINLQAPVQQPDGSFVFETNLVSSPSVMRLSGSVGGDFYYTNRRLGASTTYPVPPEIPNVTNLVPNAGEFSCGVCAGPRNGPHPVDFTFVLYPTMFFYITPISYLACFPWIRLNLTRIGTYTAP